MKRLSDVLFLDIETAGAVPTYVDLSPSMQKLWQIKARQISRDPSLQEEACARLFIDKAAIYSEFAKVVCISVGHFIVKKSKITGFRTKSFFGDDEVELLKGFKVLIKEHFNQPKKQFICGHNIREFDIPFLCRRMIINHVRVPRMLDISGKKPWEVEHLLDTLTLWKYGDYKSYVSLALLSEVLGLPTPKDDIDGSMIHETYWKEQDLRRITKYCEKDVIAVAKVFLRLKSIPVPEKLDFVSKTKS